MTIETDRDPVPVPISSCVRHRHVCQSHKQTPVGNAAGVAVAFLHSQPESSRAGHGGVVRHRNPKRTRAYFEGIVRIEPFSSFHGWSVRTLRYKHIPPNRHASPASPPNPSSSPQQRHRHPGRRRIGGRRPRNPSAAAAADRPSARVSVPARSRVCPRVSISRSCPAVDREFADRLDRECPG